MKINKKTMVSMLILAGAISVGYVWKSNNMRDYVVVTEDRGNMCTYDANGKLKGSTLAAGLEVKVKIPKASYEQYKKDAVASNKCFY